MCNAVDKNFLKRISYAVFELTSVQDGMSFIVIIKATSRWQMEPTHQSRSIIIKNRTKSNEVEKAHHRSKERAVKSCFDAAARTIVAER